ncbi:hypothetical protein MHI37_12105 [Paenibacillus sp. FSL H8-0548]|uniref:hypothetical protein n=1 Tax=Paenibacillus sp. FSL H8-0548 TaxID=1920422 RepID=UPI00118108D6|nr:hypothetical protein [Paenibacillus sp. FSL H8-0548]
MKMTTMMKQKLQKKAALLKQHEVYAYQAAYFLLENEALAEQAATQALLASFQEESFFSELPESQIIKIKQKVMKYALLTKAAMLQHTV